MYYVLDLNTGKRYNWQDLLKHKSFTDFVKKYYPNRYRVVYSPVESDNKNVE